MALASTPKTRKNRRSHREVLNIADLSVLGLCKLDSVRRMEVKHAEKVPVEIPDLFGIAISLPSRRRSIYRLPSRQYESLRSRVNRPVPGNDQLEETTMR